MGVNAITRVQGSLELLNGMRVEEIEKGTEVWEQQNVFRIAQTGILHVEINQTGFVKEITPKPSFLIDF